MAGIGAWQTLLSMPIVDSERLPKEAVGGGLKSTLRPRNVEEERDTARRTSKMFRESHGQGRADDQLNWKLAGRAGQTLRGIGISQTRSGLGP